MEEQVGKETKIMKRGTAGLRQIYYVLLRWVRPNVDSFFKLQKPKLWALAVLAGLAGSLVAILFRHAIGITQWLWSGTMSEVFLNRLTQIPWWSVVAAPTIGGLLVGAILHFWGPGGRAGGVADVIEARASDTGQLSLRNASVGTLISAITLGSGGSAGREGPVGGLLCRRRRQIFVPVF